MTTEKITITRRSKFGFGWTTTVSQVWNRSMTDSSLVVDETTSPCYTGSIRQVRSQIENSRDFKSLGGTCFSSAWFVKVNGGWKRICNGIENDYEMERLENDPYAPASVTVEVEA